MLLQTVLLTLEDVPSPTFTLVQTYETQVGPLWHSDLYRIGSSDEIEELGLSEAFEDAVCLVEWPDRLAKLRPGSALEIWLEDGKTEEARLLSARWNDPRWDGKMQMWAAQ